jgi:LacI family transcriptional regulator
VRQPIAEMAREAVRLLIEQIRVRRVGNQAKPVHKTLEYTLLQRQSSASVKES